MKKLLALLLAGIMVFAFISCAKDKEEKAESTAESALYSETEVESTGASEGETEVKESNLPGSWTGMYGVDGSNEMSEPDKFKLLFNEDGTGKLTYFSSETDFEWVEEDGKVVCTYLNEDFIDTFGLDKLEATIEGDTLTGAHLYGFDFVLAKDGTDAAMASYGPEA